MPDRGRRLRRLAGRVAAGLAVFAAAGNVTAAPAATGGAFRGVAAAEGIRIGITAVGAPVTNDVVDGASPIAQAAVDSTRGSSALASVAYPGEVVVTTPGLLAGVSGGQLSGVPPYPLMATAGSTTAPEQRVEGPGSTMEATVTDHRAEATARSGATPAADGAPAPAWATSSIVEADDAGVVTSIAASDVTGVTIGPLSLGRVVARSAVRRAPGADPVRETSFAATGLAVEGTAVALTPAGLVVAGTTTPVSATPLQPVLEAAGLSVRPLAAENTGDGVVSAGLVVTRTQELPTAVSPVTVTYTFGRALAAVSSVALPPVASADGVPPVPGSALPGGTGAGGDASPSGGTGTGEVTAARLGLGAGDIPLPTTASGGRTPAGADTTTAGSGRAGPTGPFGGGDRADPGQADAGRGARTETAASQGEPVGAAVPVRKVGSRLFDLTTIYLLLAAAAATAVAVIQFMRHAGVRFRWTSRPG